MDNKTIQMMQQRKENQNKMANVSAPTTAIPIGGRVRADPRQFGRQGLNYGMNQQNQFGFGNGMIAASAPVTFNYGDNNLFNGNNNGFMPFIGNSDFDGPQMTVNPQMLHDSVMQDITADMLLNDDMFPLTIDANEALSAGMNPSPNQSTANDSTVSPHQLSSNPLLFSQQSAQQMQIPAQPKSIRKSRGQSAISNSASASQEFEPGSFNSQVNISQSFPGSNFSNDTINEDPQLTKHLTEVEKRRRRRESHNAVERRRRDNINERIIELSTIVPPLPDSEDDGKMHKGSILKRSIEYIRLLQRDNEILRARLAKYEKNFGYIE